MSIENTGFRNPRKFKSTFSGKHLGNSARFPPLFATASDFHCFENIVSNGFFRPYSIPSNHLVLRRGAQGEQLGRWDHKEGKKKRNGRRQHWPCVRPTVGRRRASQAALPLSLRESGARRLFALADDCRDSVDRERERERAVLGTMIHNGGSRAAPAHGLRITTLRSASPHTLGGVASYMAKTFPGL